ncbi:lipoxygenase 2, chloroplastic isoform X2 [Jatropha curcas]|uniref:lipoxygenase 2, chloroplastic isoform X2 n=1 Tax=Jatropha curcas TaxID=180498 RepID=UPI0009D72F10|nr:lipoxygenase 2, chloroplastic isoform X2 [Jatropha curcas]
MLKLQLHHQTHSRATTATTMAHHFLLPNKPFANGDEHASRFLFKSSNSPLFRKTRNFYTIRAANFINNNTIKAQPPKQCIKVKAVVTVKETIGGFVATIKDLLGKTLHLELASTDLDPKTGLEKPTIQGFAHRMRKEDGDIKYEAEFDVPEDFGDVGAVFVENEHYSEIFLQDIVLDGFPHGPVNITSASWVHSKYDNKQKRVFFTSESYLPSQTPSGIKRLREEELMFLRGNGQGERQFGERIYGYDVYNDLGDPDSNPDFARPVLGGKQRPYPRRCRTGRPRCGTAIDSLIKEGIPMPPLSREGFWQTIMPRLFKAITDGKGVLSFESTQTSEREKFFWLTDEEFARQTIAGLNPCSIQLIEEWPLKSKLDPEIYGPPESAITTEIIEAEIGGIVQVCEAIEQKKLFILDYHDLLLPFVSKVRELNGRTLYGSRTVLFLTPTGILRPIAIELTRPPMDGKPQWKQVYTNSWDSTGFWLWRLAKVHVLAHDSGYHQLVSHWLRTHCVTEPYIIATNRQLSVMHPIYRLLHPHFRHTMEINALARESLISVGGIIESSFSPGKYSMEFSSVAYDKFWRFDHQALPNDLINRGMAVEDEKAPHGLKLTIEDYPFANDGLILWDIIKSWITDYVNHYYPEPDLVASDEEIQAWWREIRTIGHADKKDEPWWPQLRTPQDLIDFATTMAWVASGQHAAVNFGQYAFGGYFPNRPTIARIKMPSEDPTEEDWKFFLENPGAVLLATFPSKLQATRVVAALNVLSNHSPDEKYIGEEMEPSWADDPIIKAAFEKFRGRLKELEGIIDERNNNKNLKNRNGAGIVPYELLKPFSKPGVTGKGVPYSISI